jgi:hypothetical protein
MQFKNILSYLVILSLSIFIFLAFKTSSDDNPNYSSNGSKTINFPVINESNAIPGIWTSLATSPNDNSRCFPAMVMKNDTAHIFQFGGGSTQNQLKSVIRYNTKTNTWSTIALNNAPIATMPVGMHSGSAIAYNDTAIYVFGGDNGTGLGISMRYSVLTNRWTTLTTMLTLVTDQATVLWKNTDVFLIGGGTGVFSPVPTPVYNTVQKYNIETNTWSYAGTYPISCSMQGCGITGDTVIVAGGWNGSVAVSNSYKGIINSTGTNIEWTSIGNYPVPEGIVRMGSGLIRRGDAGGVLFTGGSIGGATVTGGTYVWDFCSQRWDTVIANLPVPRANFKCASRGDTLIYAVAGYTTTGVGNTDRLTITSMTGTCFVITDITPSSEFIAGYTLSQNYPNPFNPITKINFSIPERGFTTLKIYNLIGKQIVTLIDDFLNSGNHSINFNAINLGSGIYFYRLEVNGFIAIKRMMLIK